MGEEEEEEEVQEKSRSGNIVPLLRQDEEGKEEVQAKFLSAQGMSSIQRQAEEGGEETVGAKELPGQTSQLRPGLESSIHALRGSGHPLPESARSYFEPRFGADFSSVRVHSNSAAAETAQQINAQAFTRGRDIVFGTGRYQPQTPDGQRLLAHELTHVVQQGSATPSRKACISMSGGDQSGVMLFRRATDEKQSQEKQEVRRTEYTIAKKNAVILDEPNDKSIRRVHIINNTSSYLRSPDDLGRYLSASRSPADTAPEGIQMKGGKLTIPKGTKVSIVESKKDRGVTYQKVLWRTHEGWIKSGNTTSTKVIIPPGTRVRVDVPASKGTYAKIRWDSEEGWTSWSYIHAETWDPTYATRFVSKGKVGNVRGRTSFYYLKPNTFSVPLI